MKTIILTIIPLLLFINIHSQDSSSFLHHQKGLKHLYINSDTSIHYLEKAVNELEKNSENYLSYQLDLIESLSNHGYYQRATEILDLIKDDVQNSKNQFHASNYFRNLGFNQNALGDNKTGVVNMYNGLKLAKENQNDLNIISSYYALSSTYMGTDRLDSCLHYSKMIIDYPNFMDSNYHYLAIHDYGNCQLLNGNEEGHPYIIKAIDYADRNGFYYMSGGFKINYGVISFINGDMDVAIKWFEDADEPIVKSNSIELVNYNFLIKAILAEVNGDMEEMINLHRQGYHAQLKTNNIRAIGNAARRFSEAFDAIGESDSAYHYLLKAEDYAFEEYNMNAIATVYKMFWTHFDNTNKTDSAYKYIQIFNSYYDSLRVHQNEQYSLAIEQKFETEKLADEVEIQNITIESQEAALERNILTGILIVLCLSGVFGGIIWRNRKKETNQKVIYENQIAKLENKSLEQQLNPHFMANVTSKSMLLIENGESIKAKIFLEKALDFWRRSLHKNRTREKITLKEELEQVKVYLDINKEISSVPFEYQIDCPEELKNSTFPGFLLQPLVENSIKHGFKENSNNLLKIVIRKIDESIHIEVSDNGGKSITIPSYQGNSQGMEIVKDRIKLINLIHKRDREAVFNLNDIGSSFKFDLPLIIA